MLCGKPESTPQCLECNTGELSERKGSVCKGVRHRDHIYGSFYVQLIRPRPGAETDALRVGAFCSWAHLPECVGDCIPKPQVDQVMLARQIERTWKKERCNVWAIMMLKHKIDRFAYTPALAGAGECEVTK